MAIEFQVAADVIRTGVSPTWDELLRLGALIVLQTLLTFGLELELRTLDTV